MSRYWPKSWTTDLPKFVLISCSFEGISSSLCAKSGSGSLIDETGGVSMCTSSVNSMVEWVERKKGEGLIQTKRSVRAFKNFVTRFNFFGGKENIALLVESLLLHFVLPYTTIISKMSYRNDEIIRIINKRNTMVIQECDLPTRDAKQLLRHVTDSLACFIWNSQ